MDAFCVAPPTVYETLIYIMVLLCVGLFHAGWVEVNKRLKKIHHRLDALGDPIGEDGKEKAVREEA